MRRLTFFAAFMTCFLLGLLGLPHLAQALAGESHPVVAAFFLGAPLLLWLPYPAIRSQMRLVEEEQARFVAAGNVVQDAPTGPPWLARWMPYNNLLYAACAIGSGWPRLNGFPVPFWLRLLHVAVLAACGVLAVFLTRDDLRKARRVRAQQEAIAEATRPAQVIPDEKVTLHNRR